MRVRALDLNGDWTFGKGQNDYLTGINAIAQDIKTRLSSFYRGCFFDLSAGVDWFNLLGGKNQLAIQLSVSAVILNTPGVSSILSLSVSFESVTRFISISYKVQTSLGTISGTTELPITDNIITQDDSFLQDEDGGNILL